MAVRGIDRHGVLKFETEQKIENTSPFTASIMTNYTPRVNYHYLHVANILEDPKEIFVTCEKTGVKKRLVLESTPHQAHLLDLGKYVHVLSAFPPTPYGQLQKAHDRIPNDFFIEMHQRQRGIIVRIPNKSTGFPEYLTVGYKQPVGLFESKYF